MKVVMVLTSLALAHHGHSLTAIADDPICQRIGNPAVALVELLQGAQVALCEGAHDLLVRATARRHLAWHPILLI